MDRDLCRDLWSVVGGCVAGTLFAWAVLACTRHVETSFQRSMRARAEAARECRGVPNGEWIACYEGATQRKLRE
jgi:hypothetical protein